MYHCLVYECNVRVGDEPVYLHLLWVRSNVRAAHAMGDATVYVAMFYTRFQSAVNHVDQTTLVQNL